jgi:hypothetical protein
MNDDVDLAGKHIICYLPPQDSDPPLEMPSLIIFNVLVSASANGASTAPIQRPTAEAMRLR